MFYTVHADNLLQLKTKDYSKAEQRAAALWKSGRYSTVVVASKQGGVITTFRRAA